MGFEGHVFRCYCFLQRFVQFLPLLRVQLINALGISVLTEKTSFKLPCFAKHDPRLVPLRTHMNQLCQFGLHFRVRHESLKTEVFFHSERPPDYDADHQRDYQLPHASSSKMSCSRGVYGPNVKVDRRARRRAAATSER